MWTWRPISWIEAPSSSAATDTVPTLSEACAAAAAAAVERPEVCAAAAAMAWAVACNWAAEDDTRSTTPPTASSKRPAISRIVARRCSSAEARARALSSSICRERIRLSLKTWTDAAIEPTSSFRPRPGTGRAASPAARCRIAAVIAASGASTPRKVIARAKIPAASPPRTMPAPIVWFSRYAAAKPS